MPRYIDADARDVTATSRSVPYKYRQNLDVVEVIRCRDCKSNWNGHGYCTRFQYPINQNGYCNFAEMRENEKNNMV